MDRGAWRAAVFAGVTQSQAGLKQLSEHTHTHTHTCARTPTNQITAQISFLFPFFLPPPPARHVHMFGS